MHTYHIRACFEQERKDKEGMYALGKRRDAEMKARDHEKEKDDRARATQLLSEGMWELAVSAISKVLVSQGSKMTKAEYTKLVEQQRVAALHSIRQDSSRSLSLSLPATIAETRDFKKDAHDEVLVRLALGELDEALAACDRAHGDVVVGTVNLKAEALVMLAHKLDNQGKVQQALQALSRAGKADPKRKKDLEPSLTALQSKAQSLYRQQASAAKGAHMHVGGVHPRNVQSMAIKHAHKQSG